MFCGKFTKKVFLITNAILAFVMVNMFLLTDYLHVSVYFTRGLFTGFFTAWLIYLIFGIRELKKPSYSQDERFQSILGKASAFTLSILILLLAFFVIINYSTTLVLGITIKELSVILLNFVLVLYAVISLIFSRLN